SLPTGQPLWTLAGHTGQVWSLAFLGSGNELLSVAEDGTLRRWDLSNGTCLEVLSEDQQETNTNALHTIVAAPDGQRWATAGRLGTISIWHAGEPKPRRSLAGHLGKVVDLALSPNGKWL